MNIEQEWINAYENLNTKSMKKILNKHKSSLDLKGEHGEKALKSLIDAGEKTISKLLIKNGARIKNEYGENTILYAIYHDCSCLVKTLIEEGADVNCYSNDHGSPLILATRYDEPKIVKLLIEAGADVNFQDFIKEKTALMHASKWDYTKIINMLIEAGSDPHRKDIYGLKAIDYARKNNTVKKLADEGKELLEMLDREYMEFRGKFSDDDMEKIEYLINSGADLNLQNKHGYSALMRASFKGYTDIVKMLLNVGCNIHLKDEDGWTAIILASSAGHFEIVKMLVEAGADIFLETKYNCTCLYAAIYYNHIEVADYLYNQGLTFSAFKTIDYEDINEETHDYFQDHEGYKEFRMINEKE